MAAYIAFGIEPKHLLSAVIMTAPGTILISKMLVPETDFQDRRRVVMSDAEVGAEKSENLLGAIARTTDGLGSTQHRRYADFVPRTDASRTVF